jgi:hypothetical protein
MVNAVPPPPMFLLAFGTTLSCIDISTHHIHDKYHIIKQIYNLVFRKGNNDRNEERRESAVRNTKKINFQLTQAYIY